MGENRLHQIPALAHRTNIIVLRLAISLFLLLNVFSGKSQKSLWWASSYTSTDDQVRESARDSNGSQVYIGRSYQALTYNEESNSITFGSLFRDNLFILKRDSLGEEIYSRGFQTHISEHSDVKIDSSGYTYILTSFNGDINISTSGWQTLSPIGGFDILIWKLDSAGNYVNHIRLGGSDNEIAKSFCLDSDGNIIITGEFDGTIDMDPGNGVYSQTSSGSTDIFIVKLTNSGDFLWGKTLGSIESETAGDISVSSTGEVVMSLSYQVPLQIQWNGEDVTIENTGQTDAVVIKYDSIGNVLFAKHIGGTGHDNVNRVLLGANNEIIFSGTFEDVVDFDSSVELNEKSSSGNSDIFICQIDAFDNHLWTYTCGSSQADSLGDMGISTNGDIVICGKTFGAMDFNSGDEQFSFQWHGLSDAFYTKLSSTGTVLDAYCWGGSGSDASNTLLINNDNSLHLSGYFSELVDFSPDETIQSLLAQGMTDIFYLQLDSTGEFVGSHHQYGSGNTICTGMDIDSDQNIYITGYCNGFLKHTTSDTTTYLDSKYALNGFIKRYNSNGEEAWARSFIATENIYNITVAAIDNNQIVTTGVFLDSIDVDLSDQNLWFATGITKGSFVTSYSSTGQLLWARQFGYGKVMETTNVEIGPDGIINIFGYGEVSLDMDPGTNVVPLAQSGIFLLKLNEMGEYVDHIKLQDTYPIGNYTFYEFDSQGNIYVGYGAYFDIDVDPGPNEIMLDIQSGDAVLVKLSSTGEYIWHKQIGGNSYEIVQEMEILSDDRIVCSLYLIDPIDLDPGPAVQMSCNVGLQATALLCFDTNGSLLWTRSFCANLSTLGPRLEKFSNDHILIYGDFSTSADFDLSPDEQILETCGNNSGYLLELDENGDFVDVSLYTESYAINTGLHIDEFDNIYCITQSNVPQDIDPDAGELWVHEKTGLSQFVVVQKLQKCADTYGQADITVCDGMQGDGCDEWWSENGVYELGIPNAQGCDSLITVNLTVLPSSYSELYISACESYQTPNGGSWNESGIYSDTLINHLGCDSIVQIFLNIEQVQTSSLDITSCNSYFHLNEMWLTESGIYTDTIQATNGCDSIITLNLTIIEIDTSVVWNSSGAQALSGGLNYQWYDCGLNEIIEGQNQSTFSPEVSGTYMLIVGNEICQDSSSCYEFEFIGVNNNYRDPVLNFYPNPCSDFITIHSPNELSTIEIRIIDLSGRSVQVWKNEKLSSITIDIRDIVPGYYFLELTNGEFNTLVRPIEIAR